MPTELELCRLYGASRHTVRSAIHKLQEIGLVSRRKKVGTRVEAKTRPDTYRQSLASVDDLVQFGATHQRVVQEIREVTAEGALARELGCAEGTPLAAGLAGKLQADPASPALKIRRRYFDTGREVFEVSVTIHPMDRFIFSMRLTRDSS